MLLLRDSSCSSSSSDSDAANEAKLLLSPVYPFPTVGDVWVLGILSQTDGIDSLVVAAAVVVDGASTLPSPCSFSVEVDRERRFTKLGVGLSFLLLFIVISVATVAERLYYLPHHPMLLSLLWNPLLPLWGAGNGHCFPSPDCESTYFYHFLILIY